MTLGQLRSLLDHHINNGVPSDAHVNISVFDPHDDGETLLLEARPVITCEHVQGALYLTAVEA